ncbi:unnamed protein product [Didymodactylos carnosus]|uniref:Ion transport domain-containing protein n=1 Tax=Didymodactylos carnosus TaxID=1234261 RepID=A0A814UJZ6_9BILA|nr:unnamed protein product [Didymodactylos carnosus]CAF3942338.1 unnamed protein product [Didymodactylos carnosus]
MLNLHIQSAVLALASIIGWGYIGFLQSVKLSFLGMLGDFDIDYFAETTFQYLSVSLLIIYVVVVTVLLLNLLIAMMGDTYGRLIGNATQIWCLERARIVYAIENEMSTEERNLNRYWTIVDGERYFQVEEVNDKHFRNSDEPNKDIDPTTEQNQDELIFGPTFSHTSTTKS